MTGDSDTPAAHTNSAWRRPRWIASAIGMCLALLIGTAVLLDSSVGHRFLADKLSEQEFDNGLRIEIGRIEGSIYSKSVLHDVRLYDKKGLFFSSPKVTLDWRPWALWNNKLIVREAIVGDGRLIAVPEFRETDDDEPFLPDFDIAIGRLKARDLIIEKGVTGVERRGNVIASADIRAGTAKVNLLAALADGNDSIRIMLEAVPNRDRFALKANIDAPAGGVIAALAGLDASYRARLDGKGSWSKWNGTLDLDRGSTALAKLALAVREGNARVSGQLYPQPLLTGLAAELFGDVVAVTGRGRLDKRILDGRLRLTSKNIQIIGVGAIDLTNNAFDAVQIDAALRAPDLLDDDIAVNDAKLRAVLDGKFRDFSADYRLSASSVATPDFMLAAPVATGTVRWTRSFMRIPMRLSTAGVVNADPLVTRMLKGLAARGDIIWRNGRVSSDNLALVANGVRADLSVTNGAQRGSYVVTGDALLPALAFENVGAANVTSNLRLLFGGGNPWKLSGSFAADMRRVDNRTLTSIAGDNIRIASNYTIGKGLPLLLDNLKLTAGKVQVSGEGRRLPDGNILLAATGRHTQYGPFKLSLEGQIDTARAKLVLDDPLPSLGLRQVELALAPIPGGFAIEAQGASSFGPFVGDASIFAQPQGSTLIRIGGLKVSRTVLSGDLIADGTALRGNLSANGGGINGNVRISPQGGGQRIVAALTAIDARFEGDAPITVNRGKLDVTALLVTGRSDIDATISAQGIGRGKLFIGRIAANAKLSNGRGRVTASIAGRRGSRFALQTAANIAPNQVRFTANGSYGSRSITMARNGVLTRLDDDGWRLAPTRFDVGGGATILSGRFGGGVTDAKFQMAGMSMSLLDIGYADLGLGGTASGIVNYVQQRGQNPTGSAKLQIKNLTRSGLVLTSRPVDLALNAALGSTALSMRGIVRNGEEALGRIQARISDMPASNDLEYRVRNGRLFGQVRYAGPADALWRLIKVEAFDLTGKVNLAADATGTIENPQIIGSLSAENLRLESALSGTLVENIRARGRFAGAVLTLTGFKGNAAGGGTVSGRGIVDLGIDDGVAVNLQLQANNARLLNRDDISATVSGPLTVISDGQGGVLGGNVVIDQGRFELGNSDPESKLPNVAYRELNRRADELPARRVKIPWRYDMTATARNDIKVTGLGLDSEWSADLTLTGEIDSPRIGGIAKMVRGDYEFSGRRFELERGQVTFRRASPPDPRLDIVARANVQGLSATINVTGTGQKPEITFSSIPALPEEELLARLLFGSSINDISAPEAVQLAAAVASLRSGGGLDPINQLRSAIGLDRLRIIGADAATGQGTSIAAGKYVTRRTYVEVITDGRGYSATQVEFQITRWLSILSSISTLGRQSANVRISKDY